MTAPRETAVEHDEHAGPGEHGGHGYSKDKEAHLKRLRRIEGQVRGLHRMVDEDAYCIDVLTQVSASTKALQSFALQLLEEHLRHCVARAAVEGGPEADAKVAEATAAIARLLRT
ncbi:metal-sensitive transcriptional regulator [Streptomyces alkaliphilus]|uniref:metal-sensitive transcriptional regulator n=1 Tax=Streptomyces alkaliphilus TaxID=1472722 RepID=UPI001E3F9E8E|nr:metal-sensitive transcriptional regulator [Streptomyces alkaliphilus]